jgi:hypothetical protein
LISSCDLEGFQVGFSDQQFAVGGAKRHNGVGLSNAEVAGPAQHSQ